MKYTIRQLSGDCWIDAFVFNSAETPRDVTGVIAKCVKDRDIVIFAPTKFCLIENRLNGREHQVGQDAVVFPNGDVAEKTQQ